MFDMLHVLADALKQVMAPAFALEKVFPLLKIATIAIPIMIHGARFAPVTHLPTPSQAEPIFAGAALGILDVDDHRPTIARLPHQFLTSPSGFGSEPDRGIRRNRPATLKLPELWRLAGYIVYARIVAADLDVGYPVHHHCYCASFRASRSTPHSCPAMNILCAQSPNCGRSRECNKFVHFSPHVEKCNPMAIWQSPLFFNLPKGYFALSLYKFPVQTHFTL